MEAGKKPLSRGSTRKATNVEVAELRRLNKELKELVADLLLGNNIVNKKHRHAGLNEKYIKYMKITAQEKQEVIRLIENSELSVNQTPQKAGIAKSTFCKCYKAY